MKELGQHIHKISRNVGKQHVHFCPDDGTNKTNHRQSPNVQHFASSSKSEIDDLLNDTINLNRYNYLFQRVTFAQFSTDRIDLNHVWSIKSKTRR